MTWTRRRVLTAGFVAAGLAGGGAVGLELVSRGVLPGRAMLEELDGACSVPEPSLVFSPPGPSRSGMFYSAARRRVVGYTIAYPPRHRPGDELPLVVMLHAYGGSHADALAGLSPAQALALQAGGRPPAPMALVTVDGGDGYWNPHPGDDPMAMVTGELIPRCQRLGLGRPPRRIAAMGISMGGYGALLLAEKHPRLIAAVAAISPAIWTSYPQASQANPGARASGRSRAPCRPAPWWSSGPAATTVRSSPRSSRRRSRSWPPTSPPKRLPRSLSDAVTLPGALMSLNNGLALSWPGSSGSACPA